MNSRETPLSKSPHQVPNWQVCFPHPTKIMREVCLPNVAKKKRGNLSQTLQKKKGGGNLFIKTSPKLSHKKQQKTLCKSSPAPTSIPGLKEVPGLNFPGTPKKKTTNLWMESLHVKIRFRIRIMVFVGSQTSKSTLGLYCNCVFLLTPNLFL